MTDSQSPYTLTSPQARLYETSEGEQRVLAGITPENMGAMYGFLLGQRGQASRNLDQYGQELRGVNALQSAIANSKLANDRRQHDQTFATSLMQHGDVGADAAANYSGGSDSMPVYMSPDQIAGGLRMGAGLAALRTRAKASADIGSGAKSLTEAGFQVNPGQSVRSPEGALGAAYTTGTPLDLRVEALRQAGETGREGMKSGGGAKVKLEWDENAQAYKTSVQGTDPDAITSLANRMRIAQENARSGAVGGAGGNNTAPGGTSAGRPAPATAGARLTAEQGARQAARIMQSDRGLAGASYGGTVFQNGRNTIVFKLPGGKTTERPALTE